MGEPRVREIWFHALGAKVGGGVTYLRSVLPEIIDQLSGKGVRVVLLVPEAVPGISLPDWVEMRALPRASSNAVTRLLFDQIILPLWLLRRRGAALYCSGSFAPLWQPSRTVVLLRNAIYFDPGFLARELPRRRARFRLQGRLIIAAARRCAAVLYPTDSMRRLVEAYEPRLAPRGAVNTYGVGSAFLDAARTVARAKAADAPVTFLYVTSYTLQKNLGYLIRALALAKAEGLNVRVVVTTRFDRGAPASFARDMALVEEHALVQSGHLAPTGPKYGAELLDAYREADACVFVSFCESFGHPLVEAMALGKPLVCADLPYARELCGEHALYVDPNRPEALVDVWRRWPGVAERLPGMTRRALGARFSWRAHVAHLLAALLDS
jgi:glycosyltransferase involved in cell wall biosynthesis